MQIKAPKLIARAIASDWLFAATLLVFGAETGSLAVTSRFPMAFDEAYHFGLIQFFSHQLSPIVTTQTSSTYQFGSLIQNPSLLYHYLLSFPYRFVELFTSSTEVQVVSLRLLNIAFALGSLCVMRKLLRQLRLPDGLINVVLLVFALTPMVTVLSAQINYDNLFTLLVTLCCYETVLFLQKLDRKIFDTKALLILISFCFFSSVVKFAFLPIFLAIAVIVTWRVVLQRRKVGGKRLLAVVKRSFNDMARVMRWALVVLTLLGGLLFMRCYGVNVVKYHTPVPACNQILSIAACKQYYSWNTDYNVQQYEKAHPGGQTMNVAFYTTHWVLLTSYFLFGATMPLQGPYSLSPALYLVMGLLTTLALTCSIVNAKKIWRNNRDLCLLGAISFTYLLFLWARNYHDYLQLGEPAAINGRYWVPVLVYLYALMGLGVYYAFQGTHRLKVTLRSTLALIAVCSFLCLGGYMQYISRIDPVYGRLSPADDFKLDYGQPIQIHDR